MDKLNIYEYYAKKAAKSGYENDQFHIYQIWRDEFFSKFNLTVSRESSDRFFSYLAKQVNVLPNSFIAMLMDMKKIDFIMWGNTSHY